MATAFGGKTKEKSLCLLSKQLSPGVRPPPVCARRSAPSGVVVVVVGERDFVHVGRASPPSNFQLDWLLSALSLWVSSPSREGMMCDALLAFPLVYKDVDVASQLLVVVLGHI